MDANWLLWPNPTLEAQIIYDFFYNGESTHVISEKLELPEPWILDTVQSFLIFENDLEEIY